MSVERFDMGVIGTGVNGASAAFQMVCERKRVLVLEQFEILHDCGQSHGRSKAFSVSYGTAKRITTNLQALAELRYLEHVTGETLLFETGAIDLVEDEAGHRSLAKNQEAMQSLGLDYEVWDYRAMREKLPVWNLPESAVALYSPADGILDPKLVLRALLDQIVSRGGVIKEQEPVVKIFSDGSVAEVITAKSRYFVKNLVIACGAWTNKLLAHLNFPLPITTTQEQIVYFKPLWNYSASFSTGVFPMWYHHLEPVVYGFPIYGEPGIKLGFHRDGFNVDVDKFSRVPRSLVIDKLRAYLDRYLPTSSGISFGAEVCLYDNTPDLGPLVGNVPGFPNVFVIAGLNGNGFGPAMAFGKAVTDLSLRGRTDIEISDYDVSRFSNQT